MDLKNAVAVCLISLFSATLVVLIARSLDSQAASQLEPRLAGIQEELQAIRKQGGLATSPGAAQNELDTRLMVYYFHSNARCPNCINVEAITKETLESEFRPQLQSGEVVWKVLNYQKPSGADLARRFGVGDPVIILAWMKDNELQTPKPLDLAFALVDDRPALAKYLCNEIRQMLAKGPAAPPAPKTEPPAASPPKIPIPE
jgi:hypothetical protein